MLFYGDNKIITYGKNRKVLSAKGEKFRRSTVVDKREINKKGRPEFERLCECEGIVSVQLNYLTTGQTKPCGCLVIDVSTIRRGLASEFPKEYKPWLVCRSRCNPIHKSNEVYVANDTQVLPGKDNIIDGFKNFIEDMSALNLKRTTL